MAITLFRKKLSNGRESPTWYFRVSIGGKVVQRSTGHTQRPKAQKFARDYVQDGRAQKSAKGVVERFRDVLAGGEPIKLKDAWDAYSGKPKARSAIRKTEAMKQSCWQDFLAYMDDHHVKAETLNQVTRQMIDGYLRHLETSGSYRTTHTYKRAGRRKPVTAKREHKALSNRSWNTYYLALKQVFDVLAADSGVVESPLAHLRTKPVSPKSRDAFTPAELKKIGEHADDFMRPIFVVGMYTGLRLGDICGLKWTEVDLDAGWIRKEMNKTGETVSIPIMPVLGVYITELPRHDGAQYVLPEQQQMHTDNPSGISYRVKKLLQALGITSRSTVNGRQRSTKDLHSMRHTFCWLAAQHGMPLPVVQSIVGHLTPSMTQAYANHATDQAKVEAMHTLPDYLGIGDGSAPVKPAGEDAAAQMRKILESLTPESLVQDRQKLMDLLAQLNPESAE